MSSCARTFIPTALAALIGCFAFASAQADEVQVAVAANFTAPIQAIQRENTGPCALDDIPNGYAVNVYVKPPWS